MIPPLHPEFHFLRPLWLLALAPAALLLLGLWRRQSKGSLDGLADPALLPHLLLEEDQGLRRSVFAALACCWTLACLALAGPTWKSIPLPAYQGSGARVLVLDLSATMLERDITPSRLERATLRIRSLLRMHREGRTGLVVFAGDAHVVVPLTSDTATLSLLLSSLSPDIMPIAGDRASGALEMAAQLLERDGARHGQVLLLSDGISDQASALVAAQQLRSQGHRLAILAATRDAATFAALQELARAGGGRCIEITAPDDAVAALTRDPGSRRLDQARQDESSGVLRWIDAGPWLLIPLLALVALAAQRRLLFLWIAAVALAHLALPVPAQAFDMERLWLRRDQQAQRLLDQGKAEQAAALFTDPMRQGMALYEAGEYETAAQVFAQAGEEDADALYNQGNALARAGKLHEALAAYDRALELNPELEDARFNRDLVRKALQKDEEKKQRQENNRENSKQENQQQQNKDDKQQEQADGQGQSEQGQSQGQAEQESSEQNQNQSAQPPPAQEQTQPGQQSNDTAQGPEDNAQQKGQQKQAEADLAQDREKDLEPDEKTKENTEAQQAGAGPRQPQDEDAPQEKTARTLASAKEQTAPEQESQAAMDAWLREVPDDPAGLLRQKFLMESRKRAIQQ